MIEKYNRYYEMIKSRIHDILMEGKNRQPKEGGELYEMAHYILEGGGKLLRPYLMLLSCEAVGGDPKKIMIAAIGGELGHMASLIHDDIIDGSEVRRGIESIPKKYGINSSILGGDMLIFHSFYSLAETSKFGIPSDRIVRALEIASRACIELSIGENMELHRSSNIHITKEDYLEIIKYKTASSIRGVAECGAILGGGNDEAVSALSIYGENIGMAFQIEDDILDFTGEKEKIKRPVGEDAKNKIITLPIICALKKNREERKEIEEILASNYSKSGFERLLKVIKRKDGIRDAKKIANKYVSKAKKALAIIPPSDAKEQLIKFADFVVEREWH